jgi:hypothetical protein
MAEGSVVVPRQSHQLKAKAVDEFKRFLVIFLYLWVVFGLLSIHKSYVLAQHHLDYQEHAFAFVNALVFAKVLLVGEYFNLGTRFKDKPLIYPILDKCFIFTLVLMGFHVIESLAVGMWRGETIAESFPMLHTAGLKGVLAVGIMSFVVLLPFFGFRELARVIGRKELSCLMYKYRTCDPKLAFSGRE